MSTTKCQRSTDLVAATIYAVYGTRKDMRAGIVRADAVSTFSRAGNDPMDFAYLGVEETSRHGREHQAHVVIQAFSPEELDKNNSEHIAIAHAAGVALGQEIFEHSDFIVVTHTDSKTGHVHNHLIGANHDWESGGASRKARNWNAVKAINDKLMHDLGLEVCEPQGERMSQAEYRAEKEGRSISSAGLELHQLSTDTWRDYMRTSIDQLIEDEEILSAASVDDGIEVMKRVAIEYELSIDFHEERKKPAVTFALVDEQGEVVEYKKKRGSRACTSAGSKLGTDFTTDAIRERIAMLQHQYQAQLVKQQALLNKINGIELGDDFDGTAITENGSAGYSAGSDFDTSNAVAGSIGDDSELEERSESSTDSGDSTGDVFEFQESIENLRTATRDAANRVNEAKAKHMGFNGVQTIVRDDSHRDGDYIGDRGRPTRYGFSGHTRDAGSGKGSQSSTHENSAHADSSTRVKGRESEFKQRERVARERIHKQATQPDDQPTPG